MKRKKENKMPLPLKLVRDFEEKFPECYKRCDEVKEESKKDGMSWWNMVTLPIEATNAVMNTYGKRLKGAELQAYYSWRSMKQIFSLDSNMVNELTKNTEEWEIPVDALMNVPYPCFYVECDGSDFSESVMEGANGFFVSFDEEGCGQEEQRRELRILFVSESHAIPMFLPLEHGKTIREALIQSRGFQESKKLLLELSPENIGRFEDSLEEAKKKLSSAIHIILYLCCQNADIEENKAQKSYTRKPSSYSLIKDIPREIQKWDVGWRIGSQISRAKKETEEKEESEEEIEESERKPGSPKRPHIRAAHFHHFWTGKRGREDRKLIVRWIPPVAINCKAENELAAVIHKVK